MISSMLTGLVPLKINNSVLKCFNSKLSGRVSADNF